MHHLADVAAVAICTVLAITARVLLTRRERSLTFQCTCGAAYRGNTLTQTLAMGAAHRDRCTGARHHARHL